MIEKANAWIELQFYIYKDQLTFKMLFEKYLILEILKKYKKKADLT